MAEELDLPQHVLRFWETRFAQIRPMKRGGGRRYYRPDDVDLLRGIRRLLYGEGYTIKGVQRILKEQGLRHVAAFGQNGVLDPVPRGVALDADDEDDFAGLPDDPHGAGGHEPAALRPERRDDAATSSGHRREPVFQQRPAAASRAEPAPPLRAGHEPVPSVSNFPAAPPDEPDSFESFLPPLVGAGPAVPARGQGRSPADDPYRPVGVEARRDPQMRSDDLRGETAPPAPAPRARLSGDDLRILQTALAELLECKRLLDQSR